MTESNFWADAKPRRRGWMAAGEQALARFNAAHQPAEPDVTTVEPVDYTMSLEQYAEQRNVPEVNDFGLVKENTSGFADAKDLMGSATALAAITNPYRVHDTTGYEVRQRGIPASQVESLGGITSRGNVNPNTTTVATLNRRSKNHDHNPAIRNADRSSR